MTDTAPLIRPATDDDYPIAAAIIGAAFAPQAEALGITPESVPSFAAFMTPESLRDYVRYRDLSLFLLTLAGEAAACGACSPDSGIPGKGWLNRIAVHPAHQGAGWGTLLVRFLEDELRRRGFTRVRLGHVSALHRLHALYERLGYETVEQQRSLSWRLDITYMEKTL